MFLQHLIDENELTNKFYYHTKAVIDIFLNILF